MHAVKRLRKEYNEIQKNPEEDIQIFPSSDESIMKWKGYIRGPQDSMILYPSSFEMY